MTNEQIELWTNCCLKELQEQDIVWNSRQTTCRAIIEWTISAMCDRYKIDVVRC